MQADWSDIDAAVQVGASRAEMAVVSKNTGPGWDGTGGEADQRVFVLKTVGDEPAWLVVQRGSAAPEADHGAMMNAPTEGSAPSPIVLRAKVGRFGNGKAEERLLREVASRLEELKGREWRRLD